MKLKLACLGFLGKCKSILTNLIEYRLFYGLYLIASLLEEVEQTFFTWQMACTYSKEGRLVAHDGWHLGCPIGITVVEHDGILLFGIIAAVVALFVEYFFNLLHILCKVSIAQALRYHVVIFCVVDEAHQELFLAFQRNALEEYIYLLVNRLKSDDGLVVTLGKLLEIVVERLGGVKATCMLERHE